MPVGLSHFHAMCEDSPEFRAYSIARQYRAIERATPAAGRGRLID